MKFAVAILAAALFVPLAFAGQSTQQGVQTGSGWSESTFIAVQGGTPFTLTGLAADFDIFFYNANGGLVGLSLACGDDSGMVPATATQGEITKWDDVGALAPCTVPGVGLPGVWTYTDG